MKGDNIMKELADMILTRAEQTDTPVTNLQLQKIMYFLLIFMSNNEMYSKRAEENFKAGNLQAWPYGPVDKSTYEKYKKFKDQPIEVNELPLVNLDSVLNEWIDRLLSINVFSLVRLSHEHSFWKNNELAIKYGDRPKYRYSDIVGALNE